MGGISIWQLLIVLVIVVLLFGTKRLKSIGSDLGGAVKGFKKAITEEEADAEFSEEKRVETKQNKEAASAESVSADAKADIKEKS